MQKGSLDKKEDSNDRTKRLEEKCDEILDKVDALEKRIDKINSLGEIETGTKERKAM